MCIRAGSNELESVKNLMGMSLMAVIAESLQTDIEAIQENDHLVNDLHMDNTSKQRLEAMIADVFDGLQINLNTAPTVHSLMDKVVMSEFMNEGIRAYLETDALNHPGNIA